MNLSKLFSLQKSLDEFILSQNNVDKSKVVPNKILALFTEIGELSNETKSFKYWSKNKNISKELILEEYVDCLHFILSIGLEKNFSQVDVYYEIPEYNLTTQLLNLYVDISDFYICSSKDNYITLFQDFLELSLNLGFTEEDIENAYIKKNNENISRQKNNY